MMVEVHASETSLRLNEATQHYISETCHLKFFQVVIFFFAAIYEFYLCYFQLFEFLNI
jgi:hypothetical protein